MVHRTGLPLSLGLALVLVIACSEDQADSGVGQVGGGPLDSGTGGQEAGVDATGDVAGDAFGDAFGDASSEEALADSITLIAPVDDITTEEQARNPAFRWSNATFEKYELTVAKKSGGVWVPYFSKKDTAANLCTAQECSLATGLDYFNGKYRWSVANGPGTVQSAIVTVTSTVEDPAKADVDSIGPEEIIGQGAKTPSIAVDATGTPCVVAYHRNGAEYEYALRMYNMTAEGKWESWKIAWTEIGAPPESATGLDASRILIPDIVIDAEGRGWVYARVADQEGGSLLGHSVWIISDLTSSNPQIVKYKHFERDGLYGRQGNLSLDPFQPGFVFMAVGSKADNARWYKFDTNLNEVDSGDIPMGSTGEKFRFEISPREGKPGVLHLVGLGDTTLPNVYQNSLRAAAGNSVPWLPMDAFGEDFTHPSVGIDSSNSAIAYVGVQTSIGGYGVRINIWDGTKMLFDVDSTPMFDGPAAEDPNGNGEGRFGPQWAPAHGGGAFLCWTSPQGKIKLRYVKPSPIVSDFGPIVEVADGVQCSIATDAAGDIHLVYGDDGSLKYKKIVTR
jgi:hypothetical protein